MSSKVKLKSILVFTSLFFLFSTIGKSQTGIQIEKNNETFRLINPEKVENLDNYIEALIKADFSYHRLKNDSFTIRFESGLEVEIFSASNLLSKNMLQHDINFYAEKYPAERYTAVFKLGEGNSIIELRTSTNEKIFQK